MGRHPTCADCRNEVAKDYAAKKRKSPAFREAARDYARNRWATDKSYREADLKRKRKLWEDEEFREEQAAKKRKQRANPDYRPKYLARRRLSYALKVGKVLKPTTCEVCGGAGRKIEAHHHRGYEPEFALEVQWLCSACHGKAHRIT